MSSRLIALCFDANDPMRLARFWAIALRWEISGESDGVVTIVPTDGTGFTIDFAPVPNEKWGQNRIHLDLTTSSLEDQRESVEALIAAGGSHIDIGQHPDEAHVVMADPEGNELCLIEPTNTFLGDCPRLGAVNCDGTRALGYFWSQALGWPLVWDQNDETAIRDPARAGPKLTWSGPPLMPKLGKDRLHLDIAPPIGVDQTAEVARLESLGAIRIDIGQGDVDWVVMADPDGNAFCVLTPRDPAP